MEPALSTELEAAVLRPDEASVDNRALTRAVLIAAERAGAKIFPGRQVQALCQERSALRRLDSRPGKNLSALDGHRRRLPFRRNRRRRKLRAGSSRQRPDDRPARQQLQRRTRACGRNTFTWCPEMTAELSPALPLNMSVSKSKSTPAGLQKISGWSVEIAPALADAQIEETWAGLRPDSPDTCPSSVRPDLEGLLIATGHFRSGILLAPITARLIREWITLQSVSAADWMRFSPMRFAETRKPRIPKRRKLF